MVGSILGQSSPLIASLFGLLLLSPKGLDAEAQHAFRASNGLPHELANGASNLVDGESPTFSALQVSQNNGVPNKPASPPSPEEVALLDIQAVLDSVSPPDSTASPAGTTQEFDEAVRNYRGTGICDSWLDPVTQKVNTGLTEEEMLSAIEERPRDSNVEMGDLTEAIREGTLESILAVMQSTILAPLPLTCLIVGGVFLTAWLLGLSWQTCIPKYRSCCFCVKEKKRTYSACKVLTLGLIGIGLAGLSVTFMIFGQAGVQSALSAVGTSTCAALQMVETVGAGSMLKLTVPAAKPENADSSESGEAETPAPEESASGFLGLEAIRKNIAAFQALCAQNGPSSIPDRVRNYSWNNENVTNRIVNVNWSMNNIEENVKQATSVLNRCHMTNIFVKYMKENPINRSISTDLFSLRDKNLNDLQTAVSNYNMPIITLDGFVNFDLLKDASHSLQLSVANVANMLTPIAKWLTFSLSVEILAALVGLGIGVAALIIYILSKGRASTKLSALGWNWIYFTISVGLLATSLMFYTTTVSGPICETGYEALSGSDTQAAQNFFDAFIGSDSNIIGECIWKPNTNLLQLIGDPSLIESATSSMGAVKNHVLFSISTPDLSKAHDAEKEAKRVYMWATEAGNITVHNDYIFFDKRRKDKQEPMTYLEVQNSGLQDYDTTIEFPGTGGQKQAVFGIKTALQKIHPLTVQGYEDQTPHASFILTRGINCYQDSHLNQWMEIHKNSLEKKMTLQEAEVEIKKLRKACEYFVDKLEALNSQITCYGPTEGSGRGCFSKDLLASKGYSPNLLQLSANSFYTEVTGVSVEMVRHYETTKRYIEALFDGTTALLSDIAADTDCSFARQHLIEATYLSCSAGFDKAWNSAFIRFLGQLIALIFAIFLMVLWRIMKDNDKFKKEEDADKKPLLGKEQEEFADEGKHPKEEEEEKEQAVRESESMWA